MSNGTVIYYGGFALPDKSASANRVVSNGKLFSALGYRTVFLGVSDEDDFKIKKSAKACSFCRGRNRQKNGLNA